MKLLLVAPQLGFERSGAIVPGGLMVFGRSTARALASASGIKTLGVWTLVDEPQTTPMIRRMVRIHAHPGLRLDVQAFGGSRPKLATAVAWACLRKNYDHVVYIHVNQSPLAILPWHLSYSVWEIGREFFQPVSRMKYYALHRADRLLSISRNTSDMALHFNPGLPEAQVVHLCIEPPLYDPEPVDDPVTRLLYEPDRRERAVFILANLHSAFLDKGHQELIAGWPQVIEACSDAELWIGGDGDGRPLLEAQAQSLPTLVSKQIKFLGRLDEHEVHDRFLRCRVFAMPSRGEGFGLVFVEAARYGLPCIGGKHDSVKEIVQHGKTGLLTEQTAHDVAQACTRLLTNDDLARQLGEAGRRRYLECFRFKHFRSRLLQALELAP